MLPRAQELIASSVFCSLAHLAHRLTVAATPELERLGMDPLTYLVLGQVFANPGISPAGLARGCHISPQRLAGLLDRWESAGLVRRTGERGRGRRTEVGLTDAGVQALAKAWPAIQHAGAPERLGLHPQQSDELLRLLRLAADPAGGPSAAPLDPDDVVVLCDEEGTPTGTAPRLTVHDASTPRHLAFSAYLTDGSGRVLLTRRSLAKATWPGVWTNAACGHLRPGEGPVEGARRRVPQELGVVPERLTVVLPDFRYEATDASGVRENEICPVLTGTIDPATVRVDPAEVSELAWVAWDDLVRTAATMPQLLSPWSVLQIERLAPLLVMGGER